jgi:hypothetical protein
MSFLADLIRGERAVTGKRLPERKLVDGPREKSEGP